MSVKDLLRSLQIKMQEKSPEILTGVGLAGMITALPLTAIGTIRAVDLVQVEKRKLTRKEIVKIT